MTSFAMINLIHLNATMMVGIVAEGPGINGAGFAPAM